MTPQEARQQLAVLGVTIQRTKSLREKTLVLLRADGMLDDELPAVKELLFAAFGKSKVTLRRDGAASVVWEVADAD